MATKDLTTRAFVKRRIQSIGSATTYDTLLDELITGCSDGIEKYCRRSFYARTIDELYSGPADLILLREYPVQAVLSFRTNPQEVLRINNTSASNQRALVEVTSTGLRLTRVASGVETVDTSVTFAGNVTLAALASAVTALGNGWEGTAVSGFGSYASADLYVAPNLGDGVRSQGALNARAGASLLLHTEDVIDYVWSPLGRIERAFNPFFAPRESGAGAYRIKYTAGYTTIPEAVQEACALWVSELFGLAFRDQALTSQMVAGAISQSFLHEPMPNRVKALLAPFRRYVA